MVIATQEPTLYPTLIDLYNVTIVHRFLSPAWFETLNKHLAGASVSSSDKFPDPSTDTFRTIVGLERGEALLLSPTAIPKVGVPITPDSE
jgi:hypothetical protein